MLKIELIKSPIGNTPANRATVRALGLRKINQVVVQPDNPAVRGMIHHVKHLLKVVEAETPKQPRAKRSSSKTRKTEEA